MLRLARGERAVQEAHFELFTVTETLKLAEIQDFKNLNAISKKK